MLCINKKGTNSSILMPCAHRQTNLVERIYLKTQPHYRILTNTCIQAHMTWRQLCGCTDSFLSSVLWHASKEIMQLTWTKTCYMGWNLWESFASFAWCLYYNTNNRQKMRNFHKDNIRQNMDTAYFLCWLSPSPICFRLASHEMFWIIQ